MNNPPNLNDVASEALSIFKVKLSGAVVDDQRFYDSRKQLALAATTDKPYWIARQGELMGHAQHIIDQAKPPMTEAAQAELYARMEKWVSQRLQEAAKAGAPRTADPHVAARGAVAASGNGLKRAGKVTL